LGQNAYISIVVAHDCETGQLLWVHYDAVNMVPDAAICTDKHYLKTALNISIIIRFSHNFALRFYAYADGHCCCTKDI
jgi:hypothetical protein